MNKRTLKGVLIVLAVTMIGGIFLGTYFLSLQPMPEAMAALTSDGPAAITRERQQAITVRATVDFLQLL